MIPRPVALKRIASGFSDFRMIGADNTTGEPTEKTSDAGRGEEASAGEGGADASDACADKLTH
jgi:hypothetical protein